ncbi:hypothetical protein [Rhodovibrio sodomensis]|nr:hypothetical protein [Rhodovibrio sodomensis]
MSLLTQPVHTAAATPQPAAATAAGFRTRTAAVLAVLARRVERGAQARARRKAARMSAAELSRLPEAVRMDLGVNTPDAGRSSPLLQGLLGPQAYWAPRPDGTPGQPDARR